MIDKVIEKTDEKTAGAAVDKDAKAPAKAAVVSAVVPAAKAAVDKTGVKTNEDIDPVKAADSVRHEDLPLEIPDGEVIPIEGLGAMAYADELAFMNERVEVLILDTQNNNDTTRLVPIGVNGKQYNLLRGSWSTVPRFVLEILAKTKKESWNFAYKKNTDGSTSDTNQMHRALRYPHQFKDKNPKGMAWYDSIKDGHM